MLGQDTTDVLAFACVNVEVYATLRFIERNAYKSFGIDYSFHHSCFCFLQIYIILLSKWHIFLFLRHRDIGISFRTLYPKNNTKHNIMNEKAIIRLVRSATLKINYAGHTILIDPYLPTKEPCNQLSVYIRIRGYIS